MASEVEACSAAFAGDIAKLKRLILEKLDSAFVKDSSQRAPLHWACSGGRDDVFLYLADELKAPINEQDDAGWTPLMIATSAGHERMVSKLLENNADVNICNYTGQSALHYAASKNHYSIAELLLKNNANPNVHDKTTGATPLHRAASRGNFKVVRLLKEYGSKIDSEDSQKNTPMHLACEEDRFDVVKYLVQHGANLEARNKLMKTLSTMCRVKDPRIKEVLIIGENQRPVDLSSPSLRKLLEPNP